MPAPRPGTPEYAAYIRAQLGLPPEPEAPERGTVARILDIASPIRALLGATGGISGGLLGLADEEAYKQAAEENLAAEAAIRELPPDQIGTLGSIASLPGLGDVAAKMLPQSWRDATPDWLGTIGQIGLNIAGDPTTWGPGALAKVGNLGRLAQASRGADLGLDAARVAEAAARATQGADVLSAAANTARALDASQVARVASEEALKTAPLWQRLPVQLNAPGALTASAKDFARSGDVGALAQAAGALPFSPLAGAAYIPDLAVGVKGAADTTSQQMQEGNYREAAGTALGGLLQVGMGALLGKGAIDEVSAARAMRKVQQQAIAGIPGNVNEAGAIQPEVISQGEMRASFEQPQQGGPLALPEGAPAMRELPSGEARAALPVGEERGFALEKDTDGVEYDPQALMENARFLQERDPEAYAGIMKDRGKRWTTPSQLAKELQDGADVARLTRPMLLPEGRAQEAQVEAPRVPEQPQEVVPQAPPQPVLEAPPPPRNPVAQEDSFLTLDQHLKETYGEKWWERNDAPLQLKEKFFDDLDSVNATRAAEGQPELYQGERFIKPLPPLEAGIPRREIAPEVPVRPQEAQPTQPEPAPAPVTQSAPGTTEPLSQAVKEKALQIAEGKKATPKNLKRALKRAGATEEQIAEIASLPLEKAKMLPEMMRPALERSQGERKFPFYELSPEQKKAEELAGTFRGNPLTSEYPVVRDVMPTASGKNLDQVPPEQRAVAEKIVPENVSAALGPHAEELLTGAASYLDVQHSGGGDAAVGSFSNEALKGLSAALEGTQAKGRVAAINAVKRTIAEYEAALPGRTPEQIDKLKVRASNQLAKDLRTFASAARNVEGRVAAEGALERVVSADNPEAAAISKEARGTVIAAIKNRARALETPVEKLPIDEVRAIVKDAQDLHRTSSLDDVANAVSDATGLAPERVKQIVRETDPENRASVVLQASAPVAVSPSAIDSAREKFKGNLTSAGTLKLSDKVSAPVEALDKALEFISAHGMITKDSRKGLHEVLQGNDFKGVSGLEAPVKDTKARNTLITEIDKYVRGISDDSEVRHDAWAKLYEDTSSQTAKALAAAVKDPERVQDFADSLDAFIQATAEKVIPSRDNPKLKRANEIFFSQVSPQLSSKIPTKYGFIKKLQSVIEEKNLRVSKMAKRWLTGYNADSPAMGARNEEDLLWTLRAQRAGAVEVIDPDSTPIRSDAPYAVLGENGVIRNGKEAFLAGTDIPVTVESQRGAGVSSVFANSTHIRPRGLNPGQTKEFFDKLAIAFPKTGSILTIDRGGADGAAWKQGVKELVSKAENEGLIAKAYRDESRVVLAPLSYRRLMSGDEVIESSPRSTGAQRVVHQTAFDEALDHSLAQTAPGTKMKVVNYGQLMGDDTIQATSEMRVLNERVEFVARHLKEMTGSQSEGVALFASPLTHGLYNPQNGVVSLNPHSALEMGRDVTKKVGGKRTAENRAANNIIITALHEFAHEADPTHGTEFRRIYISTLKKLVESGKRDSLVQTLENGFKRDPKIEAAYKLYERDRDGILSVLRNDGEPSAPAPRPGGSGSPKAQGRPGDLPGPRVDTGRGVSGGARAETGSLDVRPPELRGSATLGEGDAGGRGGSDARATQDPGTYSSAKDYFRERKEEVETGKPLSPEQKTALDDLFDASAPKAEDLDYLSRFYEAFEKAARLDPESEEFKQRLTSTPTKGDRSVRALNPRHFKGVSDQAKVALNFFLEDHPELGKVLDPLSMRKLAALREKVLSGKGVDEFIKSALKDHSWGSTKHVVMDAAIRFEANRLIREADEARTRLFDAMAEFSQDRITPEQLAKIKMATDEAVARSAKVTTAYQNSGRQSGQTLAAHRWDDSSFDPVRQKEQTFRELREKIKGTYPKATVAQVDAAMDALKESVERSDYATFYNQLDQLRNADMLDKVLEFWKGGMFAIPSRVSNAISNAGMRMVRDWFENPVAAGIDAVWSKITGKKRDVFLGENRVIWRALHEGLREAWPGFKDTNYNALFGINDRNSIAKKMFGSELNVTTGAIPGRIGELIRSPFKYMEGDDAFFKHLSKVITLYKEAYRAVKRGDVPMPEGAKSAEDAASTIVQQIKAYAGSPFSADGVETGRLYKSILERSEKAMKRDTFQETLGPIAAGFNRWLNTGGGRAGQFILPFFRTPLNIAKEAIARTPLGLAKTMRMLKDENVPRSLVAEEMSKQAVGGAIMLSIAGLAADGLITGGGPEDPAQLEALKAAGWRPYSIRAGDQYISYQRFEPFSSIVGLAADVVDGIRLGKYDSSSSGMSAAIGSLNENLTSKTFLQNFTGLNNALSDPKRYMSGFLAQLKGSMVPSGLLGLIPVGNAARAIDPVFRDTKQGFFDPMIARIPGMSDSLPAQMNPMGEERKRPGTTIERLLFPWQREQVDSPKMLALAQEFERIGWAPKAPSMTLLVDGVKTRLSKEELTIASQARERMVKVASDFIRNPQYKNAPDDDSDPRAIQGAKTKAELLQSVIQSGTRPIQNALYARARARLKTEASKGQRNA